MGNAPTGTYTRRRFAYDKLLQHAVGRQCAIHIARKKWASNDKGNGKVRCKNPFQLKHPPQGFPSGYPNYEAVTVNGITEIIEQKKPEAILYVADDTAVWKQYQSIGCG
jgi:hypothetical protein